MTSGKEKSPVMPLKWTKSRPDSRAWSMNQGPSTPLGAIPSTALGAGRSAGRSEQEMASRHVMQNAKVKMQKTHAGRGAFCILHFESCITRASLCGRLVPDDEVADALGGCAC